VSPQRATHPLYAWYGDDFTGSTDVLEALGVHGVKSVLFTHTPDARARVAFSDCRAIGIAGESRSCNPRWMSRNLPAIFRAMRRLGARVNHYKVCSTFDSSPSVGSIGRAMEVGRAVFGSAAVPIVVGAPRLGRAVVYGNLFAEAEGAMYRIDRHPTMRRHPVTPMNEADLRMHLARQTALRLGLIDSTAFQANAVGQQFKVQADAGAQGIVFDGFSNAMLEETARIIWKHSREQPVFAVGSSGLTSGLLLHWRSIGLIREAKTPAQAKPTDRLLVLSGSCSPITAKQVRRAKQGGFATWRLHGSAPSRALAANPLRALQRGESVVLYTALGRQATDDRRVEPIGPGFGEFLRRLVLESGVRRVLIAGGDTATHAVKQLKLDALTFAASLAPGVPLCIGHAKDSPLHGLELALKGGQMGGENFFAEVRDGQVN
jgi:3-oxoisoapionate kinase